MKNKSKRGKPQKRKTPKAWDITITTNQRLNNYHKKGASNKGSFYF